MRVIKDKQTIDMNYSNAFSFGLPAELVSLYCDNETAMECIGKALSSDGDDRDFHLNNLLDLLQAMETNIKLYQKNY